MGGYGICDLFGIGDSKFGYWQDVVLGIGDSKFGWSGCVWILIYFFMFGEREIMLLKERKNLWLYCFVVYEIVWYYK